MCWMHPRNGFFAEHQLNINTMRRGCERKELIVNEIIIQMLLADKPVENHDSNLSGCISTS